MSRLRRPGAGVLAGAGLVVLVVVSVAVGFLALPPQDPLQGLWQRICGAAGLRPVQTGGAAGRVAIDGTAVVIPAALFAPGPTVSIDRGATRAYACAVCHGVDGVSHSAAPSLAGLSAAVIYKQLLDYGSGARQGGAMNGIAAALDPDAVLDLARFYSSRPAPPDVTSTARAPALVRVGDPMRNIAPCSSCHVAHDTTRAVPRLQQQPEAYVLAQLTAFQHGQRHNDRNAVMRSSARGLTPIDIAQLARYYAGTAP